MSKYCLPLWRSGKSLCCSAHGRQTPSRRSRVMFTRLVVLESGLGLESGLKSIFAGLGLGLGLGL